MRYLPVLAVIAFLIPDIRAAENPWLDRVKPAVAAAKARPSAGNIAKAFDAAYRADDWQAGLDLVELAEKHAPEARELFGRRLRALWRGGRITEAEELAARAPADTTDRVALSTLIQIELARGGEAQASELAHRLEAQGDLSAFETYLLLSVRILEHHTDGLPPLLRRAARLVKPENGYPDTVLAEALQGLPKFFDALGERTLNDITRFGKADMAPITGFGLPACSVTINGKGPYRLIVDTGGSIALSLHVEVADEIGLKPISSATIRGVNGAQESSHRIANRVRIGDIECRNVMVQAFEMPAVLRGMIDGVLGTGLFADGRMTLDFDGQRLVVEPSSATSAAGDELEMRIVGDAKLVTFVELEGRRGVALLDSGADAIALSPHTARTLFPDKELQRVEVGIAAGVGSDGSSDMLFVPPVDVSIGERTYEDFGGIGLPALDELLSPILGVQIDVLIGMPMFRDLKAFTVDFKACRAWVEWLPRDSRRTAASPVVAGS